jgi:hypothetical protein
MQAALKCVRKFQGGNSKHFNLEKKKTVWFWMERGKSLNEDKFSL